VFGLLAPVEVLGSTLMTWIDTEQQAGKLPKPSRVALVWENTSHGKDFQRGVSEFVLKSGGGYELVIDEPFELNGKDFAALLGKVKASNADVLLADAHLPDYITMHRQYVGAGLCHKLVSYGARGSEQGAIEALGKENVAFVLSAVWWNAALADKNALSKQFVDAFKAKYARLPEWFQALGYESARALFRAIEQAGTVDRETVRNQLAKLELPTILPGGTLTFPAEFGQQARYPFLVQQNMLDGSSPIIFPEAVASGTGVAPNPRCTN
jgi:branched-chain amino acid transport system substrate-binding protein